MSTSKVVWTEGMFLRPQHFQQFERYLENYVQLRVGQGQGGFWGFRKLTLDSAALAIGKVVIESANGVMPDGTPFSFANVDEAPPALEIGEQVRNTDVVLALPRRRSGGEDVIFEEASGSPLARFLAQDCEVQD
ncbi:MAG: type VI secretion system baseplate subunit TssK, partial [Comamonadaceae bacterium]